MSVGQDFDPSVANEVWRLLLIVRDQSWVLKDSVSGDQEVQVEAILAASWKARDLIARHVTTAKESQHD